MSAANTLNKRYIPTGYALKVARPEYGIECHGSDTDMTAILYSGRSNKKVFHMRFKSIERMNDYINTVIDKIVSKQNAKQERKAKCVEFQKNLKASEHFATGDIVVNTWGWEQTNVDFYQVIEVQNKRIKIQSIYQEAEEGSEGFMCCNVLPIKDSFVEGKESFFLRVKTHDGKTASLSNPESYHHFRKWDGSAQYKSWYA